MNNLFIFIFFKMAIKIADSALKRRVGRVSGNTGIFFFFFGLMRKDTWKSNYYVRHFVLKSTRLPLTYPWIGSEKGILYFIFTVIVCPATGPGDLKFITDSQPSFGLNQTFLIAKSNASMMWGGANPHEIYEFNKSFSCTPLKNTSDFEIKFTISVVGVYLFLTIVKGNSCLFETCV